MLLHNQSLANALDKEKPKQHEYRHSQCVSFIPAAIEVNLWTHKGVLMFEMFYTLSETLQQ